MSLQNDIEALVKSVGLELYDTSVVSEFGDTIYRVSIISSEFEDDKRKGVTMDECVELTHLISPLLDVTPPVSGEYRLEVGSPGLERKLTTIEHFIKSVGEKISFTTAENDKIKAKLIAADGNKLTFEDEHEKFEIDFNEIKKAKTYFEWK